MGEVQDTLNDLIATCRDSEEGFGNAAKGVNSENLRSRFIGIARQRSHFAEELAGYLRKMGAEPARSGRRSGIQHRGWRELAESIRSQDDPSFLVECEQGEENTLRHYERALSKDLPVPVRPIVERQRLAVQEALLELRSVEMTRRAG